MTSADALAAIVSPTDTHDAIMRVRAPRATPSTDARAARRDVAPDDREPFARTAPRNVRPPMTARARARIYLR